MAKRNTTNNEDPAVKVTPQVSEADNALIVTYEDRGDQTIVRKSNDLVQLTRNNLTVNQQRIMLHIFSMIRPEDTELPTYELSIYDFIKMTGKDPHSGNLYRQVRKNIEDLANAPIQWIKNNGTETIETFRWLQKVRIDKSRARMTIELDPVLKPHLVQLKSLYTTMDITFTLPMRSTYSIKIYELCKSYQSLYLKKKANGEKLIWDIEMLYDQLSFPQRRWNDLRRFALEKAKKEINEKTDILFDYAVHEIKSGKTISIEVTIEPVEAEKVEAIRQSISSKGIRKSKKKVGLPPIVEEDDDSNDPAILSFDYVSVPETSIPYSFGRDKDKLKAEICVKARPDKLRDELNEAEYNAVLIIIDLLATACCTIKPGDKEQDGGNVEVFQRMNTIIIECAGLTDWLKGIAARYAEDIIPKGRKTKAPLPYITKVLMDDMENYRVYIFGSAASKAAKPQDALYEAEFVDSDEITVNKQAEPTAQDTEEPVETAQEKVLYQITPDSVKTKKDCKNAIRQAIEEEALMSRLTQGQQDAYTDILDLAVYFCRRNVKTKDDGMMDGHANTQFVTPLNRFIERHGSLTELFEMLAHNLDYDIFWKEMARNPNIKNPKALFQSEVEKALLYPEMALREFESHNERVAEPAGKKWKTDWQSAFEET